MSVNNIINYSDILSGNFPCQTHNVSINHCLQFYKQWVSQISKHWVGSQTDRCSGTSVPKEGFDSIGRFSTTGARGCYFQTSVLSSDIKQGWIKITF